MDASMWASLVDEVCKKWLPILNAANVADVSTLTMSSKSDLALSAGKRKRAAAIAGLNDMALDPKLTYDDAARAAAKRFKVDVLTGRTLRKLKEAPLSKDVGSKNIQVHCINAELVYGGKVYRWAVLIIVPSQCQNWWRWHRWQNGQKGSERQKKSGGVHDNATVFFIETSRSSSSAPYQRGRSGCTARWSVKIQFKYPLHFLCTFVHN